MSRPVLIQDHPSVYRFTPLAGQTMEGFVEEVNAAKLYEQVLLRRASELAAFTEEELANYNFDEAITFVLGFPELSEIAAEAPSALAQIFAMLGRSWKHSEDLREWLSSVGPQRLRESL